MMAVEGFMKRRGSEGTSLPSSAAWSLNKINGENINSDLKKLDISTAYLKFLPTPIIFLHREAKSFSRGAVELMLKSNFGFPVFWLRRKQNSDRFNLFWVAAKFRHRDLAIFRQISLVPSIFRQET